MILTLLSPGLGSRSANSCDSSHESHASLSHVLDTQGDKWCGGFRKNFFTFKYREFTFFLGVNVTDIKAAQLNISTWFQQTVIFKCSGLHETVQEKWGIASGWSLQSFVFNININVFKIFCAAVLQSGVLIIWGSFALFYSKAGKRTEEGGGVGGGSETWELIGLKLILDVYCSICGTAFGTYWYWSEKIHPNLHPQKCTRSWTRPRSNKMCFFNMKHLVCQTCSCIFCILRGKWAGFTCRNIKYEPWLVSVED